MTTPTTAAAPVEGAAAAAAPVPGTPEYEQAMIAKFEKHTGITPDKSVEEQKTEAAKPAKPADVPDQFWNAETGTVDFAKWSKSTTEAQRKITELSTSKKTPESPAVDPVKAHADGKAKLEADLAALKAKADAKPEDVAAAEKAVAEYPAAPAAAAVLESKGLEMAEFSAEFAEHGKLSDASYEKLAKAGLPQEMVNGYIEGQKAIMAQRDSTLISTIGGDESWKAASAWANANLSESEQAAFNDATAKGSIDEAKQAVLGLKQRYEAANGKSPALLGGKPANGSEGYANMEAYKADLRDPRYNTDESFRSSVYAKLNVTTSF